MIVSFYPEKGIISHIMFLFTKRTKNVVKWFWIFFASIIILTMIFAYSGFASLAGTAQPVAQNTIPPEVLADLEAQQNGSTSPEIQALIDKINASGTVQFATPTIEREPGDTPPPTEAPQELPKPTETAQPPVPQLNFGI